MSRTVAPNTTTRTDLDDLERYRPELTAYAYRMLGSPFEAEDAVQDAMLRAWRALDRFEGRSALRTWLYRITTNVCLDMLKGRQRRARPMDLGPASTADVALPDTMPEVTWIEPIPDSRLPQLDDPAETAVARDSVRLALIAALQHLPPRQRAVLILREVLRWKSDEVAELLDTTPASVNSALQRARASMGALELSETDPFRPMDEEQQALLARYLDAFLRYDLDDMVELLQQDVIQSMPPYPMWLQGPDQIREWFLGPGIECKNSVVVPVEPASGLPAFGQYKRGPEGCYPWSIHVLEIANGKIVGLNYFLDTERLFPLFGLPLVYEE